MTDLRPAEPKKPELGNAPIAQHKALVPRQNHLLALQFVTETHSIHDSNRLYS